MMVRRAILNMSALLIVSSPMNAQVCTTTDDCSGSDECIAGMCVAPVPDPLAYAADASTRQSGYLGSIQFPALFDPPESCCFDFVGDTQPDDGFGEYLAFVEGLAGDFTQPAVDMALADGALIKTVDWLELPVGLADGPARFSLFDAHFGLGTDVSVALQGTGDYFLRLHSFGGFGSLEQFNTATLSGGVLNGLGNQVLLPVFSDGASDDLVTLPLRDPIVELPLSNSEPGCSGVCTQDEVRPGQIPVDTAGGKLGGILAADDYLGLVDQRYRDCSCAGIDSNLPVIDYGDNGTQYTIACTANTGDPSQCTDGLCQNLPLFCSLGVGLLPGFLDYDLDGNAVNDSFTVGLRVGLRGGQIRGISDVMSAGFETGDTSEWSATTP